MAHGRPAAACSTWPGRSTPRAPSTRWSSGSRAKRRPRRSAGRTGDSPRDARRAPRRRRLRHGAGQPRPVARRRGPARKKDDAEEARIDCHIALIASSACVRWCLLGEEAAELRAIARDHERSSRDERRLLNRLRADLIATFPAVVAIAGDDMGRPTFLRLLERWPTANALTSASRLPA